MTQDREIPRTGAREAHPFRNSQGDGKKPTGRIMKGADAPATRTCSPKAELGKRRAT